MSESILGKLNLKIESNVFLWIAINESIFGMVFMTGLGVVADPAKTLNENAPRHNASRTFFIAYSLQKIVNGYTESGIQYYLVFKKASGMPFSQLI
jgi:hypothetical protein